MWEDFLEEATLDLDMFLFIKNVSSFIFLSTLRIYYMLFYVVKYNYTGSTSLQFNSHRGHSAAGTTVEDKEMAGKSIPSTGVQMC